MTLWFIIMTIQINGVPQPDLTKSLTAKTYASHAACMLDARVVARHIARFGDVHGAYLCMYRHMSDAALAATQKGVF